MQSIYVAVIAFAETVLDVKYNVPNVIISFFKRNIAKRTEKKYIKRIQKHFSFFFYYEQPTTQMTGV